MLHMPLRSYRACRSASFLFSPPPPASLLLLALMSSFERLLAESRYVCQEYVHRENPRVKSASESRLCFRSSSPSSG